MARSRVIELLLIVLAVVMVYILQLGCEGIEIPEPDKNHWPETELTGAPMESTAAYYRVHLFWKGFDDDGIIQGFEYAIDDTSRNELWTFTTRTDSELVFITATDESQQQIREHSFYVRSIDNQGKTDPTPAHMMFFAQTEAQPRSIILKDFANRMYAESSLVYVAAGLNGMAIYDISDPLNVEQISMTFTGGMATAIRVRDGYVFVGDGEKGITIIDVSDPHSPDIVFEYETLGRAVSGIAFHNTATDNYLFVADGHNGVIVLNINDPTNPVFFARYSPPGSTVELVDVTVSEDGYVFCAAGLSGILALDFQPESNDYYLNLIDEIEGVPQYYRTEGEVSCCLVDEDLLLVGDGTHGLTVLQINAGGILTDLGGLETDGGSARQLAVKDDYVFLADGPGGLVIVDLSDPSAPSFSGRVDYSGDVTGVALDGDLIVLGNDDRGVVLLDGTSPENVAAINDSIVVFCPGSPAEAETLLAYSDVNFCWSGVSPGGLIVAYKFQLQGVDLDPRTVTPDVDGVSYLNLEPKDEYIFTVQTKDETGLWSSGDGIAERRFTVNFSPESYLDSIWVEGPWYGDSLVAGPIPLTATDILLPDSTYMHFFWHHTDKDSVKDDYVVGSWWTVQNSGIHSDTLLETHLVGEDVAGPLTSSPESGYELNIGGVDSFGRKELSGAKFRFHVNYPPGVEILDPPVGASISAPDSVTITIQGIDIDGPPINMIYDYRLRTSENIILNRGTASGLDGTVEGVLEIRCPTFSMTTQVVFEITPIDKGGYGREGETRTVTFVIHP